jgi:4'-phosphopantetheinyl transferase
MAGTITVLYTRFGAFDPDNDFQSETACLSSEQRRHCRRYRKTIDRQRCIAGKILLLKCLEKHGFSSQVLNRIETSRYGKPYIPASIEFNISHSGRIAICAASNEPCRIGIDIEEMVGIDFREFKDTFNKEVFREIVASDDPTPQFYKAWTAIESVMKADGRGIELSASEIIPHFQYNKASIGNKQWRLYQLLIDSDYACHLATDTKAGRVNVESVVIGRQMNRPILCD